MVARKDQTPSELPKSELVWMNGRVVRWDEATVPVMTHALNYGTGVFEGIRGYGKDSNLLLFRARDHFERLLQSAKIADLECGYTVSELEEGCLNLIRANKLREDVYVRPIIFVGFSGINLGFMGYPINTAIGVFPFKHYFSKPGLDVCVSSWTRIYDPVTPPMAKISGSYVNSVFAKREAAKNGYDEAIMLNSVGKVSEGTGENIFLLKKGKLFTPDLGSSILEGITRDTILELARKIGIEALERSIARSELYTSDEIFLTGTATGVVPVLSVDRRLVGSGGVGSVTKEFMDAYSRLVSGMESFGHDDWIKRVY